MLFYRLWWYEAFLKICWMSGGGEKGLLNSNNVGLRGQGLWKSMFMSHGFCGWFLTLALVFSRKFCEILKNTFFTEHLQMTASLRRHILHRCVLNVIPKCGLFTANKIKAYQKHDNSQLVKLMFLEFILYNCLTLLGFQLVHLPSTL